MSVKGYTNKASIENYLLQSIDATFNSQLNSWIESVEQLIDNMTWRNFIADASGSETKKIYDGNGKFIMRFDDFIIEDATDLGNLVLTIGDPAVTISTDDMYIEPVNSDRKNKIILKNTNFVLGRQIIKLTARFGYSAEVPADIELAATILVAGILNYSNNTKGKVRSETIGRYQVTYASEKGFTDYRNALGMIKAYKKYTF